MGASKYNIHFADSGLENSSPEEAKQKQPTVEVAMPPIHKSASTSKLKYEYKDGESFAIDFFIKSLLMMFCTVDS